MAELARDPRPFRQLSPEERRDRLHRLQGIGRGLLSSSEDSGATKPRRSKSRRGSLPAEELVTSDHHELDALVQAKVYPIRFIR